MPILDSAWSQRAAIGEKISTNAHILSIGITLPVTARINEGEFLTSVKALKGSSVFFFFFRRRAHIHDERICAVYISIPYLIFPNNPPIPAMAKAGPVFEQNERARSASSLVHPFF